MKAQIAVLAGDGIGPEVTAQAVQLLAVVGARWQHEFTFVDALIGGAAYEAVGSPLPDETVRVCAASDAVCLGAVGGPQWAAVPVELRPEAGLLGIRKALGLYANLRPVRVFPALADASPLRPDRVAGVDIVIVRELTGGLYFGTPRGRAQTPDGIEVVDTLRYTEAEIVRILRIGFETARQRRKQLTSVDKANVLESSRVWRELADRMHADYPDVALTHLLVDNAAMQLVERPRAFDVIVTENLFGDILSDEAAMISGSIGLLPSASLGSSGPGLYEPVHGSAPDIAGRGVANPLAAFLSAALLLRHSLHLPAEAAAVEAAVTAALADGCRTADIASAGDAVLGTAEMAAAVRDRLAVPVRD